MNITKLREIVEKLNRSKLLKGIAYKSLDAFVINCEAQLSEKVDKGYVLYQKKKFYDGTTTHHTQISLSRESLFEHIQNYCKKHELKLERSTNSDHEFLFHDGDWVYYGKSENVTIEFMCIEQQMI